MIIVLNRTNNGFVQRLPGGTPGRYPFNVGDETVPPIPGDSVFVDSSQREVINKLLAKDGFKVGRLMGGHEYLIVEN